MSTLEQAGPVPRGAVFAAALAEHGDAREAFCKPLKRGQFRALRDCIKQLVVHHLCCYDAPHEHH